MQQSYTYILRIVLAVLLLLGISFSAFADEVKPYVCTAEPGAAALDISVVKLHSAAGLVMVNIYPDDAGKFLAKGAKVARVRVNAELPVTHVCMVVPKAGWYAIALYHDENANRHFDRTFIGLPEEGYGFSNDAPALAGLPSFKSVRFEAKEGVTPLRITMRY
jgi:uncharacterized protein (DUF2141 family)